MIVTPSAADLGLLLGLSFFLGLAFEDVFARVGTSRPGGIRTFPMLALAGGMLYLLDPNRLLAFTGGLVLLGAWLLVFYREHIRERDEQGQPNVGLMVLLLNLHAYLLGAIALALPHWVAVGTTVVAVLLFTGRERLHALARRVEMKEIVTAGQFLILTGLILPLLPAVPVTSLTSITPRQAWLALVVVCTLSYGSYLAQRYLAVAAGGLWMAALGGLYSSTATTVVLARQAKADASIRIHARAGITLATGVMYVRILALVAVFNLTLARNLAMHISWSDPRWIGREDVPADLVAAEREIYLNSDEVQSKPEQAREKIVEGMLNKRFFAERGGVLADQPWIHDGSMSVGKVLADAGAEVLEFQRFSLAG